MINGSGYLDFFGIDSVYFEEDEYMWVIPKNATDVAST